MPGQPWRAQPGHGVPSSTRGAGRREGCQQGRRTWGDTAAPSSELIEPRRALHCSDLLLSPAAQLRLHPARNQLRDAGCITASLAEALAMVGGKKLVQTEPVWKGDALESLD